jgi:hypothetical protein
MVFFNATPFQTKKNIQTARNLQLMLSSSAARLNSSLESHLLSPHLKAQAVCLFYPPFHTAMHRCIHSLHLCRFSLFLLSLSRFLPLNRSAHDATNIVFPILTELRHRWRAGKKMCMNNRICVLNEGSELEVNFMSSII